MHAITWSVPVAIESGGEDLKHKLFDCDSAWESEIALHASRYNFEVFKQDWAEKSAFVSLSYTHQRHEVSKLKKDSVLTLSCKANSLQAASTVGFWNIAPSGENVAGTNSWASKLE